MPTIKQLPLATAVAVTDIVPASQGGITRGLTVGGLLASAQAAISLLPDKLLGRTSATSGGPEPVGIGSGLSLIAGALAATGTDHTVLPIANLLQADDEVVVNSGGVPKRMAAALLRGLFTAGSGVAIDSLGTISASGAGGVANGTVVTSGAGYAMSATDRVVVVNKSVRSATFITLPAAPQLWAMYSVKDGNGDAATNPITIGGNGAVDGAASFILNVSWGSVSLVFTGAQWSII